jgi:predicted AAA+ superfamily ATPase
MLALKGIFAIDEIQQLPKIFQAPGVFVDRLMSSMRFLVLGSSSPDLLRQGSVTGG